MGNQKTREKHPLWLTEEDIISLSIATGYSRQNVIRLYKAFLNDCPDGKLTKKHFKNMYRQLYPNAKSDKFCSRIFSIFDGDKDDCLNFGEYLRALKVTSNGSLHDKLKCAFQIYDLNGDGLLDKKETKTIFDHIYDMVGEDRRKTRRLTHATEKKVDCIFEKFDVDNDGKITLDEFIEGCMRDEYMSSFFKTTFMSSSASYAGGFMTPPSPSSSSLSPSPNTTVSTSTTTNSTTSPSSSNRGSSIEMNDGGLVGSSLRLRRSNSVHDTVSTASSNMTSTTDNTTATTHSYLNGRNTGGPASTRRIKRIDFMSHDNLTYAAAADVDAPAGNYHDNEHEHGEEEDARHHIHVDSEENDHEMMTTHITGADNKNKAEFY